MPLFKEPTVVKEASPEAPKPTVVPLAQKVSPALGRVLVLSVLYFFLLCQLHLILRSLKYAFHLVCYSVHTVFRCIWWLLLDFDNDMLSFKEPPVENKPHEAPKPTETPVEKTASPPQGRVSVFRSSVFYFMFAFFVYYISPFYVCQNFWTLCCVILSVS